MDAKVRFIWFSKLGEELLRAGVVTSLDRLQDCSEEVLHECDALVAPRRRQESKRPRVYVDFEIADDINVDEIERRLRSAQRIVFRNQHGDDRGEASG